MPIKDINPISLEDKRIMERCKERALAVGLTFPGNDEHFNTLEYVISNRKLNELGAKIMIPTLYDFWMHDADIIRKQTIYDYYPHNAYETVINTHPPISFYNDNNTPWMNCLIYYHVLAHIDFFWNNINYSRTHLDDFCGRALSDKRRIAKLREKMGERKRFVDYIIEFSRSIDNLFPWKKDLNKPLEELFSDTEELKFYFGRFTGRLREEKRMTMNEYLEALDRINELTEKQGEEDGVKSFLSESAEFFPEFDEMFKQHKEEKEEEIPSDDIMQFVMQNSEFINVKNKKNGWMKEVISIIKHTAGIFAPQITTKIGNEGWATYWDQDLFGSDEKMIDGHLSESAVLDAKVTFMPQGSINPYALGLKLIRFIEGMADRGKFSDEFRLVKNTKDRNFYDAKTGKGREKIFWIRKYLDDRQLINYLSDDDFEDFVKIHNLYVVGQRIVQQYPRPKREYYVKSRKGTAYRKMLNRSLYSPPHIWVNNNKADQKEGELYLEHDYEGRMLVTRHIHDVLVGLGYMWGEGVKPVSLETTVFEIDQDFGHDQMRLQYYSDEDELYEEQVKYKKIRKKFTMHKSFMKEEALDTEEIIADVE